MKEIKTYQLHIGNSTGAVNLSKVDNHIYRVEETPVFIDDLSVGDIIETSKIDSENILFIKIIKRSELKQYSWVLSQDQMDSHILKEIKDTVVSSGGQWEQVFGGLFIVYLDPKANFDIEKAIKEI